VELECDSGTNRCYSCRIASSTVAAVAPSRALIASIADCVHLLLVPIVVVVLVVVVVVVAIVANYDTRTHTQTHISEWIVVMSVDDGRLPTCDSIDR